MTEEQRSTDADRSKGQDGPHRSRRGWLIAGAVVGAISLLAGAGALVYARDVGWHHDWCGGTFAGHIEGRVDRMLSEVDATAEQKAQVTSILQSAASDVHALAGQHDSVHRQMHQILSADTVDRAALETVRAEGLLLADQASKRVLDGLADAADVLSPEQRQALVKRAEERHRRHDDAH